MCIYIYTLQIYTLHTHILHKQKLLFWMRLIAINCLTALIKTIWNNPKILLDLLHCVFHLDKEKTCCLALQFSLRWTTNSIPPQDGSIINKSETQLRLQVKVLPTTSADWRVEHVRHVQGHTQGHVRLHQVQHLHRTERLILQRIITTQLTMQSYYMLVGSLVYS